jgi:ribosomal protein L29
MADKFDIASIKNMDTKSIFATAKQMKVAIADLMLDKNMNKLKDLKSIDKKRKELARTLTIFNQKKVLEKLEAGKESK